MKLNANIRFIGQLVVLVPYKEHHVPKYHNWMKSAELRTLTASEELSMEEEFNMQKSWHEDENKCTFIVLDKLKLETDDDEVESMIGDTNLFLSPTDSTSAEAEIMIAESSFRGKGRGLEAIMIMLRYGVEELYIKKFEAKIGFDNKPSIALFKKIGFSEISRSDVFSEITLHMPVTNEWSEWLKSETRHLVKTVYTSELQR